MKNSFIFINDVFRIQEAPWKCKLVIAFFSVYNEKIRKVF